MIAAPAPAKVRHGFLPALPPGPAGAALARQLMTDLHAAIDFKHRFVHSPTPFFTPAPACTHLRTYLYSLMRHLHCAGIEPPPLIPQRPLVQRLDEFNFTLLAALQTEMIVSEMTQHLPDWTPVAPAEFLRTLSVPIGVATTDHVSLQKYVGYRSVIETVRNLCQAQGTKFSERQQGKITLNLHPSQDIYMVPAPGRDLVTLQ